MTPRVFLSEIMLPAMAWCSNKADLPYSDASTKVLLAIAGQESNWSSRAQISAGGVVGPARSFWQGEKTGGLILVATSPNASLTIREKAAKLCVAASVDIKAETIWRAIEGHDGLAYGLARLLLYSDPDPIPTTEEAAWQCYAKRLWKPGAPKKDKWAGLWKQAGEAMS